MSMDYSKIKELLVNNGYSWTKSRRLVYETVYVGKPKSINDIISSLDGQVDRVSVYRVIELYEKLGAVNRINIGWKYKLELSDKFVPHHHHLTCLNCGQVIDIEDEEHIDNFIEEVTSKFSFKPERHAFEIEGLCINCHVKQRLA